MKKCSKCNEMKDLDNYGKCSANKDGLRSDCRECRKNESKKVKLNEEQLYHFCIDNFFYDKEKGVLINLYSGKGRVEGAPVDCVDKAGYIKTVIKGLDYRVHRLMWLMETGSLPKMVDHINRIKTDNKWSNLRECSHRENRVNTIRAKEQCISKMENSKYRVVVDNKHIGIYDTMKIARAVRDAVHKSVFGEFSPY